MSRYPIFQSCWDRAIASGVVPVLFFGENVPCSRTQHGLTRVGLEPPTSGSGVRGINHQAIALPSCIRVHFEYIYGKIGKVCYCCCQADFYQCSHHTPDDTCVQTYLEQMLGFAQQLNGPCRCLKAVFLCNHMSFNLFFFIFMQRINDKSLYNRC